jgi:Family of unknown function (DUF5681)
MPRPKPPAPQWRPGQSGNPKGRPIGSRNKLNEKFILALHDDFEKYGPAVIEKVRETRPEIYLKVIASILPRACIAALPFVASRPASRTALHFCICQLCARRRFWPRRAEPHEIGRVWAGV